MQSFLSYGWVGQLILLSSQVIVGFRAKLLRCPDFRQEMQSAWGNAKT